MHQTREDEDCQFRLLEHSDYYMLNDTETSLHQKPQWSSSVLVRISMTKTKEGHAVSCAKNAYRPCRLDYHDGALRLGDLVLEQIFRGAKFLVLGGQKVSWCGNSSVESLIVVLAGRSLHKFSRVGGAMCTRQLGDERRGDRRRDDCGILFAVLLTCLLVLILGETNLSRVTLIFEWRNQDFLVEFVEMHL